MRWFMFVGGELGGGSLNEMVHVCWGRVGGWEFE